MRTYKFITQNNNEGPTCYLAISQDIETMPLSSTYGNYGQIVGGEEAGDYREILSQKAADYINKKSFDEFGYETGWAVGDFFVDNCDAYSWLQELEIDVDYSETITTCEGFNYWDGSNWVTVTVSSEVGEPSHDLIEDEELISNLTNAIENMEFVSDRHGMRTYQTDDYIIIESQFADAFEKYSIYDRVEYEKYNE